MKPTRSAKNFLPIVLSVVRFGFLQGHDGQFHGNDLEPFLLNSPDYLPHQASLNAVRLDHDEGSLQVQAPFLAHLMCLVTLPKAWLFWHLDEQK